MELGMDEEDAPEQEPEEEEPETGSRSDEEAVTRPRRARRPRQSRKRAGDKDTSRGASKFGSKMAPLIKRVCQRARSMLVASDPFATADEEEAILKTAWAESTAETEFEGTPFKAAYRQVVRSLAAQSNFLLTIVW